MWLLLHPLTIYQTYNLVCIAFKWCPSLSTILVRVYKQIMLLWKVRELATGLPSLILSHSIGAFPPDIVMESLTSTSVILVCNQPLISFTPVRYNVTLTQVNGSGQAFSMDSMIITFTSSSKMLSGLEESSTYRVTVIADFGIKFGDLTIAEATDNFTTLHAGEKW